MAQDSLCTPYMLVQCLIVYILCVQQCQLSVSSLNRIGGSRPKSSSCEFILALHYFVLFGKNQYYFMTVFAFLSHVDLSSPRGAWAFDELRRYHTRPLRINWGPENVNFRKTYFREPNMDAKIFQLITKNQINARRNYLDFFFSLRYLKSAQKTV